jgi:hypothetical protein
MHALWPILTALFHLGRWDELDLALEEHVAAFRDEPAIECQFVRDGPVIGAAVRWLQGRHAEAGDLAALPGDPLADLSSASAWQARYATLSGAPGTAIAIAREKAFEQRTYGPQHAFALLEARAALREWEAVEALLPFAREAAIGNALLAPFADRVEGELLLARGDLGASATRLVAAAEGFEAFGARFEASRCRTLLLALGA